MINTIMTAKNTFAEGLVMDFAPDNTQATTLTSALNATLLTFNGNEMSLQNDMGNGRVETAYLPEGYVPVGTCEFGDIIYIVSYNPITNKSQIGCFPSPERNISSQEIGELQTNLKSSDFQELSDSGPTGRLVASSCKKILYKKELNPGDKYIISSSNLEENKNSITDYGNTSNIYGTFPKLLKIHVVAIEDSGKINYLDSTVRWYDNFFIANGTNGEATPDLDKYRSLVSSGYSVFQSKVSGKLALLIELEKINSFSCTYDIYTASSSTYSEDTQTIGKNYNVYWSIGWNADNFNINPKYIVLTKSQWSGKNEADAGKWFPYKQDTDTSYSIDYNNGKSINDFWSIEEQPKAFYDKNGNIQQSYWYSELGRVYQPEDYSGTFEEFITSGSYEANEQIAIEHLKDSQPAYKDQVLSKLTVSRDINGQPISKYYVNAHHQEDGQYYTAVRKGVYEKIYQTDMSDDIVNNYFKTSIYKYFTSFYIPFMQKFTSSNGEELIFYPDISNLIYHYSITPAMPYGLLEELTQDGYIDFSKIGTGEIKLTNWKYYNTENIGTLTLGLEVYPESNKGVAEVAIDFYDNQGVAATYRIMNKNSYSGQFTEYIPLNGEAGNYKLSSIDSTGSPIYHAGLQSDLTELSNLVYKGDNGTYKVIKQDDDFYYLQEDIKTLITDTSRIFSNDAGILYSNVLYLAKITVKYCSVDALNNFNVDNTNDFKYFYRWYWTNTMFNQYYYTTSDFEKLQAILDLDIGVEYSSNKNWKKIQEVYEPSSLASEDEQFNNLSATVQAINQNGEADSQGNIDAKLTIGLQNTYNTFSIAERVGSINYMDKFVVSIILGRSKIENNPETPEIYSVSSWENEYDDSIYPTYVKQPDISYQSVDTYGLLDPRETSTTLYKLLGISKTGSGKELWEKAYDKYLNKYSLNFSSSLSVTTESGKYEYLNSSGELDFIENYRVFKTTLNTASIPLVLTGVHFSKYYKECISQSKYLQVLVPLVNTSEDLTKFGMKLYGQNAVFDSMLTIAGGWHDANMFHKDDMKIHVGKYTSGESGTFSGSPGFSGTWSKNYYDGSKGYAITKNSNGKTKMWDNQVNGTYIRDLLTSDIGIILYSHGDELDRTVYFVYDSDTTTAPNPSYMYKYKFGSISGEKKAPPYNNIYEDSSRQFVLGLVMKDTDGQIHLLNNLCPMQTSSGSLTQKIKISGGTRYLGNIILSILSNLFVKLPEKQAIEVQTISNVVYLQDNKSQFTKDVVYQVQADYENHNDLILMQGIQLSDYINKIKQYINDVVDDSNVNFIIQSVQKNIPIQVAFDYIQPSKIISNSQSSVMAIRLGENDYYTVIPEINDSNKLYTIDRRYSNITVRAATTVNSYEVTSITNSTTSGRLIYTYSDQIYHSNSKFYQIFTLQNDHLVLSKTQHNSSDMLAYFNGAHNVTIGGIVNDEYLTDYLKYVD